VPSRLAQQPELRSEGYDSTDGLWAAAEPLYMSWVRDVWNFSVPPTSGPAPCVMPATVSPHVPNTVSRWGHRAAGNYVTSCRQSGQGVDECQQADADHGVQVLWINGEEHVNVLMQERPGYDV